MRTPRLFVLGSFGGSLALLSWALFSTSGIRSAVGSDPVETILGFVVVGAGCAWPWMRAYFAPASDANDMSVMAFSVLAFIAIAALAYPISTAPAEGVGWYTIIAVGLVWVVYWITPKFTDVNDVS